jgi:hypothetical protein
VHPSGLTRNDPGNEPVMSTGHELGVDLAELWDAGQNHLPIVAGEFAKAVNALPTSITGIMYRSGGVGAGDHSYGSASAWGELAATLAGHLSTTADNLMDTGAALVHAANNYAGTDAEARAEFERRKLEIGTVQ